MNTSLCPGREQLQAYVAGRLGDDISELVADHLESCPTCQGLLATFDEIEDTLVERLRRASSLDSYEQEPAYQRAAHQAKALAADPEPPPGVPEGQRAEAGSAELGRRGEYQLLAKLGEGGMGTVYKALHTRLDRVVALKVLSQEKTADPRAVARFEREMKAIGRLDHPNIVRAHDARDIEGTTVLVMEYLEGRNLSALVRDVGPLPIGDACEIVRQAAVGLEYAHQHGLVHRDIKPSNVMVTPQGQVKILDLGLALLGAQESAHRELTGEGQVMGTADYMAPEQALASHDVDTRSDVYSLGCTLYKLLSGRAPFGGPAYDTAMKKMVAHLREPVPPIASKRADTPAALVAVLERMLAKTPDQRYATPGDVATALAPFAAARNLPSLLHRASHGGAATGPAQVGVRDTEDDLSSALAGTSGSGSPQADAGKPHEAPLERGTTETQEARDGIPPRTIRLAIAAAAGFCLLLGIVIWINRTRIEVPDGAEVTIDRQGDVKVTPPGLGGRGEGSGQGVGGPASGVQPPMPGPSPFLGPDGAWKLPRGAPGPAVAPFDAKKARQHQESWAKHLRVPVELANSIGMKFVLIPPGEFDLGSTPDQLKWALEKGEELMPQDANYRRRVASEGPGHRVKIGWPFYLGLCEVTQGEYQQVMGVNPSTFCATNKDASVLATLPRKEREEREEGAKRMAGQDSSRHPVETVSWDEAEEFCRRLSARPEERAARRVYRLPTEAQWEFACRAGATTQWPWGDDERGLFARGWFWPNSKWGTQPVGRLEPNAFGLYDMHGNVSEWCFDWFAAEYYGQSPSADPSGPAAGSERLLRGGCWICNPYYCRSAFRNWGFPWTRGRDIGFRVVCQISVQEEASSRSQGAEGRERRNARKSELR